MKVYSVYTYENDLLYTFSYEEALQKQKEHRGAKILTYEIDEKPGETPKEAFDRASDKELEDLRLNYQKLKERIPGFGIDDLIALGKK